MKGYGIDVSHHQAPASLPWSRFAEGAGFCIVRSSYGQMRDRVTVEHVRRARAAGLKVGLYHFFRPSQDPAAQLAIFRSQLELAGIGVGDIVPALDIEADPLPTLTAVSPAWQAGIRFMLAALVEQFGDALVYITQREFGQLGAPAWLLERPLWVAHYTGAAKPATPGNKAWSIWQHRVGPFVPDGAGGYDKQRPELDQNRVATLPLIDSHELTADDPTPHEVDHHDDGLEDLIADLEGASWERAQDAIGMAGANMREHESIEEHDTDPTELAPESRS